MVQMKAVIIIESFLKLLISSSNSKFQQKLGFLHFLRHHTSIDTFAADSKVPLQTGCFLFIGRKERIHLHFVLIQGCQGAHV